MTTPQAAVASGNTAAKYVYLFGDGKADGAAEMRNLLGGKGAGLAEMTNLGIPVPPGFTITTEVCTAFYELRPPTTRPASRRRCAPASRFVEGLLGRRFGDPEKPLLVSVRSGARVSMPGMMDTVLNLGLNDAVAEGLARETGDARFAYDSYRRFVSMYGDVVLGLKGERRQSRRPLRGASSRRRSSARGVELDTELHGGGAQGAGGRVQGRDLEAQAESQFPEDPWEQLWGAIGAVFGSWENPRAVTYRAHVRDPRRLGHRRQRAGDGLRQPGRRLRHRRRLHARPRDGRERASTASTWSTRRAKTWSPASARRSR